MFEIVTAACNALTLAFLIAAALAAVGQLRHVRAGNELEAVLAFERRFNETDLQAALIDVQDELPLRLERPEYRAILVARGYLDPRAHPEMRVCNWLNDIGAMIAGGFLHESFIFNSHGRLIDHYWQLLAPVIALLRRERGGEQYAGFEFLASRSQRWNRERRDTEYPANVPRMPLVDPWLAIDRGTADDVGPRETGR